jgi:hypothetical protein
MPTAHVSTIICVQQATGTDGGVNQALAGLPETLFPEQVGGAAALATIRSLPGIVAAIDEARSDPDDLYITTDTVGGRDNAIWPGPGSNTEMQAGQSVAPHITVDFSDSLNISLWDYDSVSDDDLLGSVTIFESEQGQGQQVKLASSTVEGSYYYVMYSVD